MATLQQELPLVLVHRLEAFDFPFRVRLESQFRLLDPFDSPAEPLQSFLSGQARSVRALLCVDPTPISAELLPPPVPPAHRGTGVHRRSRPHRPGRVPEPDRCDQRRRRLR
ncbi:hypothetical protein TorRG33x02_274170 [Trema orientale]|uniref:Uncharacterized protein n=1 Tax=Trema orientale TaxID=63057 RepID=A0A2P5CSW9_TREOI|nr:hypothetical protein TorRG33x02_274170 [Trema orientale]